MTAPCNILVSVGTDHHRFDRLIAWVDDWQRRRTGVACFFQTGTSAPPIDGAWTPYLPYDELVHRMESATAVVCHGGPATIMDSRYAGVRPIVVPRRPDLGEHVDNHQILFSSRLSALGDVWLVERQGALDTALDLAVATPDAYRLQGERAEIDESVRAFEALATGLMTAGHHRRRQPRRIPSAKRRAGL